MPIKQSFHCNVIYTTTQLQILKKLLSQNAKKQLENVNPEFATKTKDFLNVIDFLIDQDCKINVKIDGKNVECDVTIHKDGIVLSNSVSVSHGYDEENNEDLIEIKNPGADYCSAALASTKGSGIFFKNERGELVERDLPTDDIINKILEAKLQHKQSQITTNAKESCVEGVNSQRSQDCCNIL